VDLTDSAAAGLPGHLLLARVEIAETPEVAVVEISQTIAGALPRISEGRYTTIIDLDNDPATGCDPAELGLSTAFKGAELVTNVRVQAPFQPKPTVWRCEGGRFVDISGFTEARL
jgi:hypothetical protein